MGWGGGGESGGRWDGDTILMQVYAILGFCNLLYKCVTGFICGSFLYFQSGFIVLMSPPPFEGNRKLLIMAALCRWKTDIGVAAH